MFKKFIKNQRGAIISIEFAIILPIFLLLIFMFIELCRLLFISSVLDLISVEGSYYVAKASEDNTDYSQIFYDKISKEIPLWPLVTSDNNLNVNIVYCSLIDDATQYIKSKSGNCYGTPFSNALAIFSVKYEYSPIFSNSLFSTLETVLNRDIVVFKEY